MMWTLYQYCVSADGGKTWTIQWLTSDEAREEAEKYGHICENLGNHKLIFA